MGNIVESELSGMDRRITRKFWSRRRIVFTALVIIGLFIITYGVMNFSGSTCRMDSKRVTISEVFEGDFQEFISVTATVAPLKTFFLDATEGGTVGDVFVEQGAILQAGDSILRLDNTAVRLDIMYREAQLYEQINNLRNTRIAMEQRKLQLNSDLLEVEFKIGEAERQYDVAKTLRDKKLIPRNDFKSVKDEFDYWSNKRELTIETMKQDSVLRSQQVEQLEASVIRMQTNLEFVKKRLEDLLIKAPISGQLTSLNAEVGEAKRGGERMGQIDNLDGFKLQADIDEYYVSRVSAGQTAKAIGTGVTYPLKISKVYPEIAQGKFKIDLEFQGKQPDELTRGQTLQIRLALGDLSRAILLPRGGFYNATGGRWAYVLHAESNEAYRQEIELGRQNSEVYEVLKGLQPGDRVITSSYETFAQYDKIILE